MFIVHDVVMHKKTKGMYTIVAIPDEHRMLEYCRESFYVYKSVDNDIEWLRCKSEMEDGRFILVV